MPELPEVETVCKHLQASVINHKIKEIIIRQKSLRWPIDSELSNILPNKIIKNIDRRAKYLLLDLTAGHLIMHLGMSGKISVLTKNSPNYNLINKHDHFEIIFTNNTILRYNDPRRFGAILWTTEDPQQHSLLTNLGPEPFDPSFTAEYMFSKAQKITTSIKQFIMNNNIVVGVGNIYANEALFATAIHPLSITKNINLLTFKNLIKHIQQILTIAIAQGGTSLRDYVDPNGNPGSFAQTLKVYGRTGKPCFTCNNIIKHITIGQRTAFFCDQCQQ